MEVCGGEKADEGSVKAIFGGCVRSGGGAIGACGWSGLEEVVESIRISAGEWRMEGLTEVGNIFKCAAFGDQCG